MEINLQRQKVQGVDFLSIDGRRHAMQSYNVLHDLKLLKEQYDADYIIEIGTSFGILTLVLAQMFDKAKIISFDINNGIFDKEIEDALHAQENVELIIEDCFTENSVKRITDIINNHKKVIIMCDGGDKPREFNLFSSLMQSGHVIMAHDYIKNRNLDGDYRNKIWNWFETTEGDIANACKANNLKEFLQEDFYDSVWAIRIKE